MIILNSKRFSFGGGILLFAMVWLFYTRRLRIGTLTNANEICVSVLKGSFKETRNTAVFEQKFIPQKIIKSKLERFDYKAEMKTLIDRGVRSDDPALVDLIQTFTFSSHLITHIILHTQLDWITHADKHLS